MERHPSGPTSGRDRAFAYDEGEEAEEEFVEASPEEMLTFGGGGWSIGGSPGWISPETATRYGISYPPSGPVAATA